MRIGSLFAGVGGLELGLEAAGVGHVVWQVEARRDLWPAATAKGNRAGLSEHSGDGLATAVRKRWATATAGDYRGGCRRGQLGEQVPGCLNPEWTELLMGFPLGYTEAPIPKPGSEE